MDTFKRFNFKLSFDKQKIAQVTEQEQIDRSLAFQGHRRDRPDPQELVLVRRRQG